MTKTADYSFDYKGSTIHLRLWEGGDKPENPVVVVEPGRGVPFEKNRVGLATELAASTDSKIENLQWFEQSADNKMRQFRFEPYSNEHRPYANDMSRTDYEAAEKKGLLKPDIIKGHHAVSADVSGEQKQALEARVGEPINSYEQRQSLNVSQKPDISR